MSTEKSHSHVAGREGVERAECRKSCSICGYDLPPKMRRRSLVSVMCCCCTSSHHLVTRFKGNVRAIRPTKTKAEVE